MDYASSLNANDFYRLYCASRKYSRGELFLVWQQKFTFDAIVYRLINLFIN